MSRAKPEPVSAERPVVVAIPKGRVQKQLGPSLARAGIDPAVLLEDDRRLVREDPRANVRFLLLKPDDVPTYVEYGAADLGIVGRDVLMEREADLYVPLDLGIGRCRMMVCGVTGGSMPDPRDGKVLRVATKFTNVASRHFRAKGRAVELIFVQGSVELAPLTGLADVIVDLVETGETLRQNGLSPYELVTEVSSVVVANRAGYKLHRERIDRLLSALAPSDRMPG